MRKEIEVINLLDLAYQELDRIAQNVDAGNCHWRMQKRFIDALEWVLQRD